MNLKITSTALSLLLLVACKTTSSQSEVSSVSSADMSLNESRNLGFETEPSYVSKKTIILTFDDGVDAIHTPKVLNVLREKGVKASFFINATANGNLSDPAMQSIVKQIVSEGHELANHTANHLSLPSLSAEQIDDEIRLVDDYAQKIVGKKLTLIRAPFGEPLQSPGDPALYHKVVDAIAKHGIHIGWNLDSDDWRCHSDGCVTSQVNALLDAGRYGIILFHSTNSYTAQEIGGIIDSMKARGYEFGLVEDAVRKKNGKSSAEILGLGTVSPPNPGLPFEPTLPSSPVVPQLPVSPSPVMGSSCGGELWVEGKSYEVGSQVIFEGQQFTSVNERSWGSKPKASPWFWKAGDFCQ